MWKENVLQLLFDFPQPIWSEIEFHRIVFEYFFSYDSNLELNLHVLPVLFSSQLFRGIVQKKVKIKEKNVLL